MELEKILSKLRQKSGTSPAVSTFNECPICNGLGSVVERINGEVFARECECEIRRRTVRRVQRSGLGPLLESCRFATYQTPYPWQRAAKELAQQYLSNWRGKWFFIGGASGCGKTHLCTALCGELMNAGKELRFFQWRSDTPPIKAAINDASAYRRAMDPLKNIRVLYIDDFLKGDVTVADRNLAFDLLNFRYNLPQTATVISSERTLPQILGWDEAIGSRIAERAKGYVANISGDGKNWRLK